MFLEAQFGPDNVSPIPIPKLPTQTAPPNSPPKIKDGPASPSEDDNDNDNEEKELEAQHKEIERLHKLGIPVPGVEIRVDKMVARVWLEDLEVECAQRVFADRVRAVVERAVEVTAPLWA